MRIKELDSKYAGEYLADKSVDQVEFSTVEDLIDFFEDFRPMAFLSGKRPKSYHVVIAEPMGLAEDDKLLYRVYGVADQADNGYFLGRSIPPKMAYTLTIHQFLKNYKLTQNYALSNDQLTPTKTLLNKIVDDHQAQIQGAMLDRQAKLVLLTTTIPNELSKQIAEARENGTKSTNKDDQVTLVKKRAVK